MSWLNRFTTGRIPADAKGATMAELDEPADENQIENRSQNNIFCSRIINLSFNALAYNTREHLLIVNVILKDGIRMFLNTLTKKNRSQLQNNIFFLWWNNKPLIRWFSIKYERTFCSLLVFPPPLSPLPGSEKYNASRKISARIICYRIRCMYFNSVT